MAHAMDRRRRLGRMMLAVVLGLGVVGGASGRAEELRRVQYRADLTDPVEAKEKVTRSDTEKGAGGWVQTTPIAMNSARRPPSALWARVVVQPLPARSHDGQGAEVRAGDVYVRYSPDQKHWSSWQVMQAADTRSGEAKGAWAYISTVQIPQREREEYGRLLLEHQRLAKSTDEASALKWIQQRDPEFLARQIPFVAYAEFLVETPGRPMPVIKAIEAEIGYGVSGLMFPWED